MGSESGSSIIMYFESPQQAKNFIEWFNVSGEQYYFKDLDLVKKDRVSVFEYFEDIKAILGTNKE